MNKQQAIQTLTNSKVLLSQRFGVNRLALFGSTARGTATANSDVDILVGFDGVATSQRYFGVQLSRVGRFCPRVSSVSKLLRVGKQVPLA